MSPRAPARDRGAGRGDSPKLDALYEGAIKDTVEKFEATGSPVITDGEQRKYHNFWTHSVHGAANTAPDGFAIAFAVGHSRRMPRLTKGAVMVQVDFTEGRLAMKIDPSGALLTSFIDLSNLALSRFSSGDRARIGIPPARAAIATRPTAPTSTTPSSCRASSSSRRETSTSRSPASPTACAR